MTGTCRQISCRPAVARLQVGHLATLEVPTYTLEYGHMGIQKNNSSSPVLWAPCSTRTGPWIWGEAPSPP